MTWLLSAKLTLRFQRYFSHERPTFFHSLKKKEEELYTVTHTLIHRPENCLQIHNAYEKDVSDAASV